MTLSRTGHPSKNDEEITRKLVGEAAKRPVETLKELQEVLARSGCVLHVTTIFIFFICLCYVVGWQHRSLFFCREKYPSLASFPEQNTSGLPKSMWENDKTWNYSKKVQSYAHHQKSTIATLKHGSSSIMLQLECHLSSQQ